MKSGIFKTKLVTKERFFNKVCQQENEKYSTNFASGSLVGCFIIRISVSEAGFQKAL